VTKKENDLAYYSFKAYETEPAKGMLGLGSGEFMVDTSLCERPMNATGYDCFSVHWTDGHYSVGQEPIISDFETWRQQLRVPNLDHVNWEPTYRSIQNVDRANTLVCATLMIGPFERTTTLTSYEDCLVNCISEPEEYSALIGVLADHRIATIHKIYEIAQPDIFIIHDDWGSNQATLISPELWRQTIKPHIKRIYDACKEHGAIIVQHSCGRVGVLVPDMIEMGANVWEAQVDCNDIDALRAEYGNQIRIRTNVVGDDTAELPPPPTGAEVTPYAEPPVFLY